ncbi:hypothetical protein IKQ02_03005 [bacterium]|nr:hypothetical protein [bacterium]
MIAYGIITIVVGMVLCVLSVCLYNGNIELLHSYHRENVKEEDRKALGISTGLSLLVAGLGTLLSGLSALLFRENINSYIVLSILFGSLFLSIVLLFIFIKKYNGKIIS